MWMLPEVFDCFWIGLKIGDSWQNGRSFLNLPKWHLNPVVALGIFCVAGTKLSRFLVRRVSKVSQETSVAEKRSQVYYLFGMESFQEEYGLIASR